MTKKHFDEDMSLFSGVLNAALGIATLVVTCKVLRKLHHIHHGLKEIRAGREEIAEGRNEILGREPRKK